MPLLELDDVEVSYGSVRATHGISLVVEEGETLRSEGLAVILAEQNALWAMSLARRTAVIDLGRIHLEGPSEVLRHHEDVRRAYLGT